MLVIEQSPDGFPTTSLQPPFGSISANNQWRTVNQGSPIRDHGFTGKVSIENAPIAPGANLHKFSLSDGVSTNDIMPRYVDPTAFPPPYKRIHLTALTSARLYLYSKKDPDLHWSPLFCQRGSLGTGSWFLSHPRMDFNRKIHTGLLKEMLTTPACERSFDRTVYCLKSAPSNEHPTQPTVGWVQFVTVVPSSPS